MKIFDIINPEVFSKKEKELFTGWLYNQSSGFFLNDFFITKGSFIFLNNGILNNKNHPSLILSNTKTTNEPFSYRVLFYEEEFISRKNGPAQLLLTRRERYLDPELELKDVLDLDVLKDFKALVDLKYQIFSSVFLQEKDYYSQYNFFEASNYVYNNVSLFEINHRIKKTEGLEFFVEMNEFLEKETLKIDLFKAV